VSALADALAASQSRAVAALAKQYVGGTIDRDDVEASLGLIGLTDETDTQRWIAALDIIRQMGAELPRENGKPKQDDPASEAQWTLIRRLADERTLTAPEPPLTKAQASEIINELKAGTYDPSKYVVPF
jgi:hypothetical protein